LMISSFSSSLIMMRNLLFEPFSKNLMSCWHLQICFLELESYFLLKNRKFETLLFHEMS